MKKLLGIIILGLLLSANAFAETINYSNGDKYIGGHSLMGNKKGQGTYFWVNGDKYVGNWKKGKRHGQGTFTWASGEKYVGEFKMDKRHGNGSHFLTSGDKYVGEYKNGDWNGQGTYTLKNGEKYVGEFKNDKFDGIGTWIYSDGSKKKGIWKNNKFVKKYEEPVKEKKKVKVAKSSSTQSSTTSTKDKITQSKQICSDLGFQPKTEKHADCAMQMMSIQFETTNKVASASGGTTQEVIVTHRNDYDIWDALLDFSAAIDPKNQSTSSSSSSNRGTSCFAQTTTGGHTIINCD
jgi:hypothetical protein